MLSEKLTSGSCAKGPSAETAGAARPRDGVARSSLALDRCAPRPGLASCRSGERACERLRYRLGLLRA